MQAVANVYIGMGFFGCGDYPGTVESLRHTTGSLAEDLNRERFGQTLPPVVLAQGWMAFSLGLLGQFSAAIASGEQAVAIAESGAHTYSRTGALSFAGHTHLLRGNLGRAAQLLEQGVALCRATDIRLTFPLAASGLGHTRALMGRLPEALDLLRECVDVSMAITHVLNRSLFVGLLGEACLLAGRYDEALEHATRAFDLSRRQKERGWEASTLRLLGEIHSHPSVLDTGQAHESYRQAMTLATELGMRPLLAHCHFGLGKLCRRLGKRREAMEHLTAATSMYRQMDMQFWLPAAEAELQRSA
jgi:tetratricopeptide (TPR) repeat protein